MFITVKRYLLSSQLANDYEKFKKLVAEKNVDCYIVNTGDFMGKKVKPADTLGILEAIVEGKAEFKQWGPFSDMKKIKILFIF